MVDQTGGAPAAGYVIVVVMAGIVVVALVCGVIAALVRRHRSRPGRHREQPHLGYADSEDGPAELHRLGIDPPVSLLHSYDCAELEQHVSPIGFDAGDPVWTGDHGESDNPDAVGRQCMCGHPDYALCPDWLGGWDLSEACSAGRHGECDGVGVDVNYGSTVQHTCVCDHHAVPLSAAIKWQRARRRLIELAWRRDRRDRLGGG